MSHEITTLLGKDSEFDGSLQFDGVVRIDGHFKGEIRSEGTLALGPSAVVHAEIYVRTCVIEGNFSGNLTATESVEIRAPARVKGTIATPEIQVERGVRLDGKCTMEGMDAQEETPTKKKTSKKGPAKKSINGVDEVGEGKDNSSKENADSSKSPQK